jgi:hypothetical protein
VQSVATQDALSGVDARESGKTIQTEASDAIVHSNATQVSITKNLQPLLELTMQTVNSDESSLDDLAHTEVQFLQQMQQSPQLIDDLLKVYLDLPSGGEKQLLRSLLAATESSDIEQRAIETIITADGGSKSDWLVLLRDLGINSSDSRNKLFEIMPNLTESEDLSAAILSIAPQVVSAAERETILSELYQYTGYADEQIRSAAIESLSKWADSNQAYIIEQALFDTSDTVRQTAVFAAYASTIKSEQIRSSLLAIMNDNIEDWHLRMDAHDALKGYPLQGVDYDDFYQFHLQQQVINENNGDIKG